MVVKIKYIGLNQPQEITCVSDKIWDKLKDNPNYIRVDKNVKKSRNKGSVSSNNLSENTESKEIK